RVVAGGGAAGEDGEAGEDEGGGEVWTHRSFSGIDEAEGDVERLDVLGERADGDAVHARIGDGAHVGELHAAGSLELGARAGDLHRLAHLGDVEVVDEDQAGAGLERLAQLVQVLHFHLQEDVVGGIVHRLAHGFAHAAAGVDVVFLDEDAVVEA